MKPNTDNQQYRHSKTKEESAKALEKLEELWDRQIMRGDDDCFEGKDPSKLDRRSKLIAKDTLIDGKPVSKRRGRRM